ncbi:helix-turn-helix domain-containing protein [Verrucomicrobiota bacterium]
MEQIHTRVKDGFSGQRLIVLPGDVQGKCKKLPVVRDLYVTDIGHFPSAKYHYVQRRKPRKETILIYCTGGSGWCRMKNAKWRLTKGKAFFIPEGECHTYGADRKTPWTIYWIHFKGRKVADFLEALGVDSDRPVLNIPDTQLVTEAFEDMYSYVHQGYTESCLLALSTELARFLGMLKVHQRSLHTKGRKAEEKILRSIHFMREHLSEHITLAALARHAGLSPSHYSCLFKRQTNISPVVFFARLKLQYACELLDVTDLSVEETGRRVGYKDPFYFCRIFKKMIGMAPSYYRKREFRS